MKSTVRLAQLAAAVFLILICRFALAQTNQQTVAGDAVLVKSSSPPIGRNRSYLRTENWWTMTNYTLFEIILELIPVSIPVLDEADLPDDKFDLSIETKHGSKVEYWNALEKTLKTQFKIVVVREKRPIDIYEIRTNSTPPAGLKVSDPTTPHSNSTGSGREEFKHYSMDDLEAALNKVIELPVYNETGLTNSYDFSLSPAASLFEKAAIASVSKLGLEIVKTNKVKDVSVIKQLAADSDNHSP